MNFGCKNEGHCALPSGDILHRRFRGNRGFRTKSVHLDFFYFQIYIFLIHMIYNKLKKRSFIKSCRKNLFRHSPNLTRKIKYRNFLDFNVYKAREKLEGIYKISISKKILPYPIRTTLP